MKTASIVLVVAGAVCEVFAYWGIGTVSGRRAFDEMAGMIPLAAGAIGVALLAAAAALWWFSRGLRL